VSSRGTNDTWDGGIPGTQHPEWNWGGWVNTLSRDYLDGKLQADVRDLYTPNPLKGRRAMNFVFFSNFET
jgi:hypothetical protein